MTGQEPESEVFGKRVVLVTGAAGTIGRFVCRELTKRGHRVRAFDRVRGGSEAEWIVGDLTDAKAVGEAVTGVDAVVHLAATPHDHPDFMGNLLPNNIVGTYQIFLAVKEHGIKRLIVTSSIQVVNRLAGPGKTVRVRDGPGPDNHYGVTKLFAENMGDFYAHSYDISVVAVRPGWVPRVRPQKNGGPNNIYLSPGDAGRFFADCVDSKKLSAPGFEILFALSRSRGLPAYDIGPAKELIGYEPQETWPEGVDDLPTA